MSVASRKQFWLPLLLALLLVSPSLFTGLQLDDYYHWGLVTGNPLAQPGEDVAGIFKLFTFLDGNAERTQQLVDQGMLPWWTLPDVKYMFWRPVSEITHGIDYLLWPDKPLLMHLHSLLYFLLLLLATHKLLQRWLTGHAKVWAFWVFCLSYTHGFAAGWLANRNAVLATLFVVLTLYYHDRWRREHRIAFHGLALLCFALGLLSGEMGVSGGLFLLAYALCYEGSFAQSTTKGTTKGTTKNTAKTAEKNGFLLRYIKQLFTIAPYGVLGIVWLAARGMMGYGAEGSGHYVDPTQFSQFLLTVSERYLILMNGLFWSLPPEFESLMGNTLPVVVALAGFGLLGVAIAPLLKANPLTRFFVVSVLLMLIPVCATTPHSRLLIAASLPFAALAGLYLGARADHKKQFRGLPGKLAPVATVLLVVSLLVLSPLLLAFESVQMKLAMDGILNQGAKNLVIKPDQQDRIHVVLNPPVSSVAGYIQGVRAYHGLNTASAVIPLVSALDDLQLQIEENGFEITAASGLYQESQESLLRASTHALQPGDTLIAAGITVTVLAVNDAGVPTQARFQFPPDSDRYIFHLWRRGKPVQCRLSPAGSQITLTRDTESC